MPIEQQKKQGEQEKQITPEEEKAKINKKSPPKFEKLLENTGVEYRKEEENQQGWWAQAIKGEIIPIIYKRAADSWIFPY